MMLNDDTVCLYNAAGTIRLKTKMALPARKQIIRMCYGDLKGRKFVKALCDHNPADETKLQFKKGDIIEIISRPTTSAEVINGCLYGKIDIRMGELPVAYVVIVNENMEEIDCALTSVTTSTTQSCNTQSVMEMAGLTALS